MKRLKGFKRDQGGGIKADSAQGHEEPPYYLDVDEAPHLAVVQQANASIDVLVRTLFVMGVAKTDVARSFTIPNERANSRQKLAS